MVLSSDVVVVGGVVCSWNATLGRRLSRVDRLRDSGLVFSLCAKGEVHCSRAESGEVCSAAGLTAMEVLAMEGSTMANRGVERSPTDPSVCGPSEIVTPPRLENRRPDFDVSDDMETCDSSSSWTPPPPPTSVAWALSAESETNARAANIRADTGGYYRKTSMARQRYPQVLWRRVYRTAKRGSDPEHPRPLKQHRHSKRPTERNFQMRRSDDVTRSRDLVIVKACVCIRIRLAPFFTHFLKDSA